MRSPCSSRSAARRGADMGRHDRIGPYANIAVVVTPDGGDPQCIFDGYVLSSKIHMPAGPAGATVDVWGQDAERADGPGGEGQGMVRDDRQRRRQPDLRVLRQRDPGAGQHQRRHPGAQRGRAHLDAAGIRHRLPARGWRGAPGGGAGSCARARPGSGSAISPRPSSRRPGHHDRPERPGQASTPVLDFSWDVARPTKRVRPAGQPSDADQDGVRADTADSGLPPGRAGTPGLRRPDDAR